MSKENDKLLFCRACLKEVRNRVTSTYLLQSPEPGIHLGDNGVAQSYLQCYYYCLGRDCNRVPFNSLSDYAHICLRCKELLMKVTKFIVNSQTNEEFLISMCETGSVDDNRPLGGINEQLHDSKDPMYNADEFAMKGEYLETTENESSTNGEEKYLHDTQFEHDTEMISDMKSDGQAGETNVLRDYYYNGIGAFEEVIIEVAKNNCELEQTLLEADGPHTNRRLLEQFLYFSCERCAKVFNYERQLYEHYNSEHDHKSFGFPCDICSRRHISFKALRFHRYKVHKNFEYIDCEICGKVIVSKFYESHKEQHIFKCDKCDKSFKSKYAMHKHLRINHEIVREKRFDCQECDRYFFSSENLKLHIMAHNNNIRSRSGYNFSCYICSKSFSRPVNLKQHLQWHRGDTLKCPHCNKQFTRLKDLEVHIRFHIMDLPYKSDQRFAIEDHLNSHIKGHNRAQYQCHICDEQFVCPFSLRQHSYHHSGWPLMCKLCDKGFSSVFLVRRHIKTAHRDQFKNRYSDDVADKFYERHKIREILPKVENILYVNRNECKGVSKVVTF